MTDNQNRGSVKLTVDKFIFSFPEDLRYSDAGLWIRQEEDLLRIGLSDFAQQRNGDIAFANLPAAGSVLEPGDEIAAIETVKVNISLPSPIRGTVAEINPALETSPELISLPIMSAAYSLFRWATGPLAITTRPARLNTKSCCFPSRRPSRTS